MRDDAENPCDENADEDAASYAFMDAPGGYEYSDYGEDCADAVACDVCLAEGLESDKGGGVNDDVGILEGDERDEKADSHADGGLKRQRNAVEDVFADFCER